MSDKFVMELSLHLKDEKFDPKEAIKVLKIRRLLAAAETSSTASFRKSNC